MPWDEDDPEYQKGFRPHLSIGESKDFLTEQVLWWFGRERRGSVVNVRIQEWLAENEYAMTPPIDEADYYGTVTISHTTTADEGDESEYGIEAPPIETLEIEPSLPSRWILSTLKEDGGTLDSLGYRATVGEAIETMREKGRSKLPLFFTEEDRSTLIGTVILSALTADDADVNEPAVEKAQRRVPVVNTAENLFDWIPAILQNGFIYGKNSRGEIVQIYTTKDVAAHLHGVAHMFVRVNEIEELVRSTLTRFDSEEVKEARDQVPNINSIRNEEGSAQLFSPADLRGTDLGEHDHAAESFVFSDYIKCFGNTTFWHNRLSALAGFENLDRDDCLRSMNAARIARNKVMHGGNQKSLESLTPALESLAVWLRKTNDLPPASN